MGENEGIIHRVSVGGISASHPELKPLPIFVGPSVGEEFNVVRSHLVPSACFRREDNSFDFDSSFIFDFDAGPLRDLLVLHPGSKLSIFGHTDPVGRDDFNKILGGRRAQSIFGLLLRDIPLWEDLYRNHDTQGKDKWGVASVQIMLNRTEFVIGRHDGVLDELTKEQLKQFETARGLAPSGFDSKQEIAKPTFKQLATEYMDVICTDDDDKLFKLTRGDFLARGKGKDGKGDIQGCGEFNPILLFSKADKARLDQKENQPDRDEKNRPNRRVMILLFHPGSEINPTKWPCPTVKEGVSGCKVRFFSDGEKRRSNQAEEREFAKTKDTFACRFYHRLLEASPCERIKLREVFSYGIEIGVNFPWTDEAKFRIVSEDGIQDKQFAKSQGVQAATHRLFSFAEIRPGVKYKGSILDKKAEIEMFGFVDLSRVMDPDDPLDVLPPPQPPTDKVGADPGSPPSSVLIGPLTDIDEDAVARAVDDSIDSQLKVPF